MDKESNFLPTIHYGHNIKRIREILGIKQDALATKLNMTQQAVSDWENKAQIDDKILEKVAEELKINIEVIKNFNDELAIDILINTFKDSLTGNFSSINGQNTVNQKDKYIEILKRLLEVEREKNALLEELLALR